MRENKQKEKQQTHFDTVGGSVLSDRNIKFLAFCGKDKMAQAASIEEHSLSKRKH